VGQEDGGLERCFKDSWVWVFSCVCVLGAFSSNDKVIQGSVDVPPNKERE